MDLHARCGAEPDRAAWMIHDQNTALLRATYNAPADAPPAMIRFTPLCTHRDHHGRTRTHGPQWRWQTERDETCIAVTALDGTPPYFLAAYGEDGAPGT